MRLTFLGTGTSAGVPVIACECGVCTSSDPRDKRLRSGAAVTWTDGDGQSRVVLIDATPDLREQALRAGLKRCDAVVFTHNHVDHTFGLDEVRRFNAVQGGPIDVFAEPHTIEHLHRVFAHVFDPHKNVNPSFVANVIVHTIEPGEPIELFGVRFTPIRLLHGRLPIVGYRIEAPYTGLAPPTGATKDTRTGLEAGATKDRTQDVFPLAYCTDVSAIPPESWRLLKGVKTLVLDALRHRKHPTHFTLSEALNVAERVGAEQTWFTHMAHELGHEQTEAELPGNVRLAYDGLSIG